MTFLFLLAIVAIIVIVIKDGKKRKVIEDEKTGLSNELLQCRDQLKKHQAIADLNAEILSKKAELDKLDLELKDLGTISNLNSKKKELESEICRLISECDVLESTPFMPDLFKAEEYKTKLSICKANQADLITADTATFTTKEAGTKKEINGNKKQILRSFNAECESIFIGVTVKNIDNKRAKVNKSFEVLNKLFAVDGVGLSKEYLQLKLEELNLYYYYDQQLQIERDFQKAAREQLLEEEKVRREIEQAKKKIEKEETQFKNEIDKLMKYMQAADSIEKQLYIDKIKELEEKLKLVEKDKEDVLNREQNTRAGYVYVISNVGSFGEDVYKIGMTRRLEPMDRIKELGDASVPFSFDVHALIFSEDAPGLETILHQTFRKYEVNKVNKRKEFFKVALNEVKEVVKNNHNATVNFIDIPDADEYRASMAIITAEPTKICEKCGKENDIDAKFCIACGNTLKIDQ